MSFNLSERAYSFLRNKLALGELPPGARLINRTLAKEVGVSLTPVREALNRMVSEGLLEYRAGLGTFVPVPNLRDLKELYDLRKTLECDAVGKAVGQLRPKDMMALEKSIDDMAVLLAEQTSGDVDEPVAKPIFAKWRAADTLFHTTLLRVADNRRVMVMVANLQLTCQIQQHWKTTTYHTVFIAHRDHGQIINALKSDDVALAQEIMRGHIDRALMFAVQSYERCFVDGPCENMPAFELGMAVPQKDNGE